MSKIIVLPTGLEPVSANKIKVNLSAVGDDGKTNHSSTYTWDFTQTAAANLTALKTAIAASMQAGTGTVYTSSDVFLFGGLV